MRHEMVSTSTASGLFTPLFPSFLKALENAQLYSDRLYAVAFFLKATRMQISLYLPMRSLRFEFEQLNRLFCVVNDRFGKLPAD